MASIPLPALAIKEPASPLEMYQHIIGIKGMLMQQQGEQQQQQIMGSQLKDIDAGRAMLSEIASAPSGTQITPEYIQKLGGKYGASLNAVNAMQNGMLTVQQHVSDIAKNDAATKASNLETVTKQHDVARGQLLSIVNGPQADKQANWAKEIADAEQAGTIKPGAVSNVYPGDEAAQALADHYAVGSTLAKEATERMAAQARQTTAQTGASEFAAKQNPQNPLYSPTPAAIALGNAPGAQQIQTGEAAQAGRVAGAQAAAKQPYEMQLEQVRQQVQQTFQNNQNAQNKIEANVLKPFQDKMTDIGQLQSAIAQADQGNEAAARAALFKMIGVAQPTGTHRINPQEVKGFSSMGGISDRVVGSITDFLNGNPWTAQRSADIKSFAEAQGQTAQANLNSGIGNVNKLYNTNVGQGLLQIQVKDPQGGIHTFPDQASADRFKKLAGIQ